MGSLWNPSQSVIHFPCFMALLLSGFCSIFAWLKIRFFSTKFLDCMYNYPTSPKHQRKRDWKVDSDWNYVFRFLVCEPQTSWVQEYFNLDIHLLNIKHYFYRNFGFVLKTTLTKNFTWNTFKLPLQFYGYTITGYCSFSYLKNNHFQFSFFINITIKTTELKNDGFFWKLQN